MTLRSSSINARSEPVRAQHSVIPHRQKQRRWRLLNWQPREDTGHKGGILVQHRANSAGDDWYGVLKRAMLAGCSDAWLAENGFHTHGETRRRLSDPMVRQRIAEAKVDVMAIEYGWEESDMIRAGDKGEAVKAWQTALIDAGYSLAPYNADGSFGPLTGRQTDAFKAGRGFGNRHAGHGRGGRMAGVGSHDGGQGRGFSWQDCRRGCTSKRSGGGKAGRGEQARGRSKSNRHTQRDISKSPSV